MKKLFTIAAAVLLAVSSFAQDGRSIYNKFSDEPGVSAVFISPSMFKLIGKIPAIELGDGGEKVDITPIIKSLKGFYLISCDNASLASKLSTDIKKFVNAGDFELMMEAKDSGETVSILTSGDDDIIQSFVMTVTGGSETTFISMDGLISREAFERLMERAMN